MIGINTSVLTYHLYKMDLEEALEEYKEMGFENLEIGYSYSLKPLKHYQDKFNYISYHHFTELSLDEDFQELKEEFQKPVKISKELGVKFLSFHPQFEDDREKAIKNLIELEEIVPQRLCIENFPPGKSGFLFNSPRDFREIRGLGSGVGILFDIGHCPPEDIEGFLKFKKHIETVHLQDALRNGSDIDHLPLGAGNMDLSFLEKLADKPWILEIKHGDKELLKTSRLKAEMLKNQGQDRS